LGFFFDAGSDLSDATLALFDGVKETQHGIEIKFQDRGKALESGARHLGVFKDEEEANPFAIWLLRSWPRRKQHLLRPATMRRRRSSPSMQWLTASELLLTATAQKATINSIMQSWKQRSKRIQTAQHAVFRV